VPESSAEFYWIESSIRNRLTFSDLVLPLFLGKKWSKTQKPFKVIFQSFEGFENRGSVF